MKDHPNPRAPRDPTQIHLKDEQELQFWTKKLGCTRDQLKAAVKKVGPNFEAVRAELGCQMPLSALRDDRLKK